MDENVRLSWEHFLHPETLRGNLIIASVFIAAYEMLEASIVERIKDFFTNGFNEHEWIVDPKYQKDVLNRNRSPVFASLDWLLEMKAIDKPDLERFRSIKECRNELVHQLPKFLTRGIKSNIEKQFEEMVGLLKKIESWWIINVDIATDPDLHDKEIDYEGVISGSIWPLQLLLEIALGIGDSAKYYESFKKASGETQ